MGLGWGDESDRTEPKFCKNTERGGEGALPETRATGNIHKGIMAGKLNGAIPAQTPRGT